MEPLETNISPALDPGLCKKRRELNFTSGRFWGLLTVILTFTLQVPKGYADVVGTSGVLVGTSDDAYSEIPGLPGFFFWDIRNNASVELSETYDRRSAESQAKYGDNAYGSLKFSMTDGSDKAGIANVLTTPIPLADYTGGSFDWYRAGLSTNPSAQSPAFFLTVDADGDLNTDDDRFGLKYEFAYNGGAATVPVDSWETAMLSTTTNLWSWNAPDAGDRFIFNITLDDWKTKFPNAVITVFGIDAGSGWNGVFEGAVDLITLNYGAESLAFDFELLPSFRPDLSLGERSGKSSLKGNNKYRDDTSALQRLNYRKKATQTATSFFVVENDGNRLDAIEFRGNGLRNRNIVAKVYEMEGGKARNITGRVLRGGIVNRLNPGRSTKFKTTLKLNGSAKRKIRRGGAPVSFEQKFRAMSSLDRSKTDVGSVKVHFN